MTQTGSGTPLPPVARKVPRLQVIHGEAFQDDYGWLRDRDNPEVHSLLRAENAYTDAVMRHTEAFQETLYTEILGRIKEDDRSVPYRFGRHLYYSRTETGKQYPILCRQGGNPEAPEEVTLDLNRLAEGHPFLSLGAYTVSDDGHLLAYSVDHTGFREYTLHVRDLRTGTLLPDRIEKVSTVAWAAQPDILFYVTEDAAKRPYRVWLHRLGSPQSMDTLVWEETDALFRVGVWRSRSLAYVFAASGSFTSSEVRYTRADRPEGPWRLIAEREKDHEYAVDHGGELFYIRTNGGGRRNFRLVVAPVDDPAPARWRELIPHRDDVMLDDAHVFAGHYVVHEREDGLERLRIADLRDGVFHHVAFPEPTYEIALEPNAEFDTPAYRFRYQSLTTPSSVYDYDVAARRLVLLKQTEVLGGYDPTRYRSERLHATASDGTRIPVSLVSRVDSPRDAPAPMLLTGYGAYGFAYPVTFSSARLSLLDRGVTFAIAHVRGGGEMGKRWHDEGRMLNKPNTFTDFIATADFLVQTGRTAPERLVIDGGSAGGLLIGAVLNMRPDLAAAAVLRVPFVDVINTMLDESLPLTVGEFEEWGNPKERPFYERMRGYCPYTNLGPRRYPAILVRTSLHDSQVMYWEPAKWVARLRTLNAGDAPVLLKTDMDAGHGGASGRYDALRETAFDYAFILWQLDRMPTGAPDPA
jgi:oligopeptidase B